MRVMNAVFGAQNGVRLLGLMTTAAAVALLLPSPFVFARSGPAAAQDSANAVRSFDIPRASLTDSLALFGRESGWQVSVHGDLVQGVSSPGVVGTMTRPQALERLLAGTGLAYGIVNGNTVTLRKLEVQSAAPELIQLGPVRVEGATGTAQDETAWGPVPGYVAHRSAAGTKTDASILETPQSISVITRDQLDAQAVESVSQALRYTVGVNANAYGVSLTGSDTELSARGFQLDQFLDGLKLLSGEFGEPQVDPYFLERIEVLHGPASVLYGQANPGGVVELVSKRPTADAFYSFEIRGGSYGQVQGAFDIGGPVTADGKLLYRLTGIANQSDSQIDYVHQKRIAIGPALTWLPDDDTSLTVIGNFQHDPSAGFFGYVPASGTLLPNPNGKIPTSFFEGDPNFNTFARSQYQAEYLFEHRFDDAWTIRQNFRYGHVDVRQDGLWPSGLEADGRTLSRYTYGDVEHNDSVGVDTQGEFKTATGPVQHTLLFGVDYFHYYWDQASNFGFDGIPGIDVFAPKYGYTPPSPALGYSALTVLDQVGLYAQDQMRYGNWVLLVGGREDWANGNYRDRLYGTDTGQADQAFTWRTGVVYAADNGLAPYFSYAKSFNPTTAEQSGTDFAGKPFKPTTAEQFEGGIKYQPPGLNSFLTAAGYDLTEQNVTTTDPLHPNFDIQQGEVRSRGAELTAVASLTEGLNLTAAYSYTENVVTKSSNVAYLYGINTGKTLPNVPTHLGSIWADYTFQTGALTGFGFAGGIRYVGAREGDQINSFKVPDYTLVDAAFHYEPRGDLKGWKLAVNAANLFDKQYVAYCYTVNYCSYGLRRTVYATVKYNW